jgi:hypothetical protein
MSKTVKQPIDLARNIIIELDKQIQTRKDIIKMIDVERNGMFDYHTTETIEELIQDHTDFLKQLEKLRDFVIYKA